MGKIVPNSEQAAVERVFAAPANRARAIGQQQQGQISGQVPGTDSPPLQPGIQTGLLQPSSGGDQVAAVGHAVLANDGTPVVVMGNMAVSGDSGYPPSGFQDGGFAFTDASGNAVAGYSHPTGLWGFGGGGLVPTENSAGDAVADSPTIYACDGSNPSLALIQASPPSWMDTEGNITAPGLYASFVQIEIHTPPTTPGLYVVVGGAVGGTVGALCLDALSILNGISCPIGDVTGMTEADLPWGASFGINLPTDSTGQLSLRPHVQQLASAS